MTDILCGSLIQAADFPPTQQSWSGTDQANLTGTTFADGSPVVEVTFTAPTSGRVLIYIGGTARNNGANSDYPILGLNLREDDSSGAVVESPATEGLFTCRWAAATSNFASRQRIAIKTGLTPGQTYYASVQHRTSTGAGTADIGDRLLIVRPLP